VRDRLSQGEWIVLVIGLLLLADLIFLPWHAVHLTPTQQAVADAYGFDPTPAAVQSPGRGYGIAAVIFLLVMIVQILIARFTTLRLPQPPVPWSQIHLIAGIFVLVVLAIKLIRDTSGLGYGAYSGILGGVLVAYGGYLIAQNPGEVVAQE
jgi:hypothetical protein